MGQSFPNDAEYIHRNGRSQNFSEASRPKLGVSASLRFCGEFFKLLRKSLPIACRPEALENVNLIRIRADQNARLAAFHAAQDSLRSLLRRSPRQSFESLDIFFALGRRGAGADPSPPSGTRFNAAR